MTIEELRRVVVSRQYATTVARAFRVALGLPLLLPPKGRVIHKTSYRGIGECFRNADSPMNHL